MMEDFSFLIGKDSAGRPCLPDISYQSDPPVETVHPRITYQDNAPFVYFNKNTISLSDFLKQCANGEIKTLGHIAAYRASGVQTTISFNQRFRIKISERFQDVIEHLRNIEQPTQSAKQSSEAIGIAPNQDSALANKAQSPPDASIVCKDSLSEAAVEQQVKDEGAFDPSSIEDARLKTMAAIVRRRGQKVFREGLFIAYSGRCAITGCDVREVLEAAHIFPYKGDLTNHITNGILLRADIHTLFDLGFLAIEPESNRICLAPMIQNGPYGELHGKRATFPVMASQRPSNEALRWRYEESACS